MSLMQWRGDFLVTVIASQLQSRASLLGFMLLGEGSANHRGATGRLQACRKKVGLETSFLLAVIQSNTQHPCLPLWQGLCFPVTAVESSFQLLQRLQRQCHCSLTITSPPASPPQRAGSWPHGTTPLMCKVLSNSPPICLCFHSLRGQNCLL